MDTNLLSTDYNRTKVHGVRHEIASSEILWTVAEKPLSEWGKLATPAQSLMIDSIQAAAGTPQMYIVPFSRVGRIGIFAILPIETPTIASSTNWVDPPIPFPMIPNPFGTKETADIFAELLQKAIQRRRLPDNRLQTLLWRLGEISKLTNQEIYFLIHGLLRVESGSWRHIPAYAPIVAAETAALTGLRRGAFDVRIVQEMISGGNRLMLGTGE